MNVEFVRPFRYIKQYANLVTAEPSDVFIFARNALTKTANKNLFDKIISEINRFHGMKGGYRGKYSYVTNIGDSNSPYHFTVAYRSDKLEYLASYTLSDVNLR